MFIMKFWNIHVHIHCKNFPLSPGFLIWSSCKISFISNQKAVSILVRSSVGLSLNSSWRKLKLPVHQKMIAFRLVIDLMHANFVWRHLHVLLIYEDMNAYIQTIVHMRANSAWRHLRILLLYELMSAYIQTIVHINANSAWGHLQLLLICEDISAYTTAMHSLMITQPCLMCSLLSDSVGKS